MASGKLPPRQKMINMMYLVLTALLAMNVDQDLLNSFVTLGSSLRGSSEKFDKRNHELLSDIKEYISKEEAQNDKKNSNIKPLLTEVSAKTDGILKYLEKHVTEMVKIAKPDTNGVMASKDEMEKPFRYWMKGEGKEEDNAGRGAGQARFLRDSLNAYVAWANAFYEKYSHEKNKPFQKLAIDPKEDAKLHRTVHAKKTWERYTFDDKTAVVAAMALLEKYKNDVNVIESEVLEMLKRKLANDVPFRVKNLVAVDAPKSEAVIAGMDFETELFVTMVSDLKPSFSGNGQVKVGRDGSTAKMTVKSMAVPKGKDEMEQTYTANIRVPRSGGKGDTTLKLTKKFKVLRPQPDYGGPAINKLYRNCANEIYVKCPQLGTLFNPVYEALGGKVNISQADKTKVRLVPNEDAKNLAFELFSNTNGQKIWLDNKKYEIVEPPKPSIELLVNGKSISPRDGIPAKGKVKIKAVGEKSFIDAMPKDAKYEIGCITVFLKSSMAAAKEIKKVCVSNEGEVEINLLPLLQDASPTSIVYFEIDNINRVNYEKKKIEEKRLSKRDLTFMSSVNI